MAKGESDGIVKGPIGITAPEPVAKAPEPAPKAPEPEAKGPKEKEPEEKKKHPVVMDINQFGGAQPTSNKIDWLKNMMSKKLTHNEYASIIDAAEDYSDGDYKPIHKGKKPEKTKLIDQMIDDPNSPVYGKNSYRGLCVTSSKIGGQDPIAWIQNVIASGVWKETGVSSFSASKSTAMSFGAFGSSYSGNKDVIHILITNKGHTTGMPFKHISLCSSENEVLQSSTTMKKGMKIIGWHTNKAGNEFFIDVDDSL